jgi:hypothetical protein
MFSFADGTHTVIERNARHGDMMEKYPDSYMIVRNGHLENETIHGDVIAILTQKEYESLDRPRNLAPKFTVWKGTALIEEEVNNRLGFFV